MNFSPKKWTKNHFMIIILHVNAKIKYDFIFRAGKNIKNFNPFLWTINKKRTLKLRVLSKNILNFTRYCGSHSFLPQYLGSGILRRQNRWLFFPLLSPAVPLVSAKQIILKGRYRLRRLASVVIFPTFISCRSDY